MKHFFLVLLLAAFPIHSQTVSNVTAELVNNRVSVQYNLQSTEPANCFLSYSTDGGRTFHPCANVSGDLWSQTSGAKTIVWNYAVDNITQGSFFFKVEALKVEQAQPAVPAPKSVDVPTKGILINGVRWATSNVDSPGTFAANPEDLGMLYQWNRRVAWPATRNVTGWKSSTPLGSKWEKANDPSPAGWRVPTHNEIIKLSDEEEVIDEWVTINGVKGRKFTDKTTGNSIFLPAAGYRSGNGGAMYGNGIDGYYWSSTLYDSFNANGLYFFSSGVNSWNNSYRSDGYCIRPVAE